MIGPIRRYVLVWGKESEPPIHSGIHIELDPHTGLVWGFYFFGFKFSFVFFNFFFLLGFFFNLRPGPRLRNLGLLTARGILLGRHPTRSSFPAAYLVMG